MTAEPRPLAVGDWIKSNDPRRAGLPALLVMGFGGVAGRKYAKAHDVSRRAYPWLKDIHLDGKPRRSGWSRVEPGGK